MKVCREFNDVTSAGKLFHVGAAATGNARSPTVQSRVAGTSNADVDDDRRRCRPSQRLAGVSQVGRSKSRAHCYTVTMTASLKDIRCGARHLSGRHKSGCCIHDHLAAIQLKRRETGQRSVSKVKLCQHQSRNNAVYYSA